MSEDEARRAVIANLMDKAARALAAAQREHAAGEFGFAMNRVYYACFYAASAVLLHERRQFVRHSGVRSALHRYLVKPGRLPATIGDFYDRSFRDRQEADYGTTVEFEEEAVAARIEEAAQVVAEMHRLLAGL